MIKSFQHKGLKRFFESGTVKGIQSKRLRLQLAAMDTVQSVDDISIPGYRLQRLKGKAKGRWSIWVSGNWRLTSLFDGGDVTVLGYEDYH